MNSFWFSPFTDWVTAVSTFLLVVFTVLIYLAAKKQLGLLVKSSKSDLLFRIRTDFFSKKEALYFMLIDQGLLTYHNEAISYFKIDRQKLDKYNMKIENDILTAYELDNYLLGQIEEIGYFERNAIITFQDVYQLFSVHIEACGNNKEIQKYIKGEQLRDSELYVNFAYIYEKCTKETKLRIENL